MASPCLQGLPWRKNQYLSFCGQAVQKLDRRSMEAWVQSLYVPPISCVTVGNLLKLQSSYLGNGHPGSIYLLDCCKGSRENPCEGLDCCPVLSGSFFHVYFIIYFILGSLLLPKLFSSCRTGVLSSWGAQAFHCSGISVAELQAAWVSVAVVHGQLLRGMWAFPNQG